MVFQKKEYKLFDFNANPQQSWSVLFQTKVISYLGDSVVSQRTEKLNHDQTYIYILYSYWFYPKNGTKILRKAVLKSVLAKRKE